MKIRIIAAVLAAFFMLPAFGVTALAAGDDCYYCDCGTICDCDITDCETVVPSPQGIIDITPQAPEAPTATITVTDNTGEHIPAPPPESVATRPGAARPFTPSGTGTVQDNATDGDGKEFFTITTPDENVFYLVIDRQRGTDNVYLLNAVTEADLMSLAKVPERPAPPPVTELPPAPAEPDPEPPAPDKGGGMGSMVLVVLIVIVGGGAGWYFKIYRPKQQQGGTAEEIDDEEYDIDDPGLYDDDDIDPELDYDGDTWPSDDEEPDGDDKE